MTNHADTCNTCDTPHPTDEHNPMTARPVEPTDAPALTTCSDCGHDQHPSGAECSTLIGHGTNHMHACLCLARPGAALSCPPQMTCQGGTLGYGGIWNLQRGHELMGVGGVIISPDVLRVELTEEGGPLREQVAAAIRRAGDRAYCDAIAEEVLSVRDRRMEQLAAGRATWKRKAEEMERDRDRLAGILPVVEAYVIESNNYGGLDCNDLVTRLQEAGYELPGGED